MDSVGRLCHIKPKELSDVVIDGHLELLLDVELEAVEEFRVVLGVEQVVHVGDEQNEATVRPEPVHPLIVWQLLESEFDEDVVKVLLPKAWGLLNPVEGFMEEANDVAVLLKGVQLRGVNDGVGCLTYTNAFDMSMWRSG
ncbi:unnamed protein product [Closterium sp. NIES-54]